MPSSSSRRSRTWTSKRRATSCENFSGPDCSADSKSASAAQDTHGPDAPTAWVPESSWEIRALCGRLKHHDGCSFNPNAEGVTLGASPRLQALMAVSARRTTIVRLRASTAKHPSKARDAGAFPRRPWTPRGRHEPQIPEEDIMRNRWIIVGLLLVGCGTDDQPPPARVDPFTIPAANDTTAILPYTAPPVVNYELREQLAPLVVRERLQALRADMAARHLTFEIGYTTAMDVPISKLAGTREIPDLARTAAAQNRLANDLVQIEKTTLVEAQRLHPEIGVQFTACSADLNTFSWAARGKVTPIRNQDGCGSCWVFGTTAAFEGSYAIRNNSLIDASEQDMLNCSGVGTCGGGVAPLVYNRMISSGIATESAYPYTATDAACNATPSRPYRAVTWGY